GADLSGAYLRDADLSSADLPMIGAITALKWSGRTFWGRDTDEIWARSVEQSKGVFVLNPTGRQADALADH
ncbi:pentapeptide repeat-containing protein, partial [Nocardia fluminea]|uniref:pentapeptide repeat-containing protein n=1 Tax=Nocardia fluminea TaxID=134984 RepID=UPI003658D423